MKPQQFEIVLDNKDSVFNSGELVSGRVCITLQEAMKLRGIRVELLGENKVGFWQHQNYGGKSSAVHYSSHETYIKAEETVWKSDVSGQLPPGSHQFSFKFQLPIECPTSFESGKGRIRYNLKATLDRPWHIDNTCESTFTVISPTDLSTMAEVSQPIVKSAKKSLILASGELKADVKLGKSGFVAGEVIPVSIAVQNDTGRDIKSIVAKLIRNVCYTGYFIKQSGAFTQEIAATVAKVHLNEVVQAGKFGSYELITIPTVPPSISNCKHLRVEYCLLVEVIPSGPSFSLDIEVPITIGTIPTRSKFDAYQSKFGVSQAEGLPTYAECLPLKEGESEDETEDKNEEKKGETSEKPEKSAAKSSKFIPKYPFLGAMRA